MSELKAVRHTPLADVKLGKFHNSVVVKIRETLVPQFRAKRAQNVLCRGRDHSLFPARRKHPCAREGVLYFSRPGELGGHT